MRPQAQASERTAAGMKPLFRLALRQLRNNSRFSVFFALNLAVGLVGLSTIESLRFSLERALGARSRVMLAADMRVSARRQLSESERTELVGTLPAGAGASAFAELVDLFSMVGAGDRQRLVQIRAVEENYPLYGKVRLAHGGEVGSEGFQRLQDEPIVWVDEPLARELDVSRGGTLRLGGSDFRIADEVLDDPTNSLASFALAPRVYISRKWLNETGLLRKGSTATWSTLVRLPPETDLERLEEKLNQQIADPGVRVRSHLSASEESARLFSYLNDYLGLVSLAAFLLAAVGTVFQFRRFFVSRSQSVAILLSLGATHREAFSVFMMQLAFLGLAAGVMAVGLTILFLPLMGSVLAQFSPVPVEISLNLQGLVAALVLGLTGSMVLCWPQLHALSEFSAASLFREESQTQFEFRRSGLVRYIPALLGFILLSVFLARSWKVGLSFSGGMAGTLLLLALVAVVLMKFADRISRRAGMTLRMALRHLVRARSTSALSVIAIGLSAMLISLIPQIRSGLEHDLAIPKDGSRPALFLFDIQDEQVDPLKEYAAERDLAFSKLSPMVRARLVKVNGESFAKDAVVKDEFRTREDEQASRSRNRSFNLSWQEKLSDAEEIMGGRPFSGRWDESSGELPEVSVEHRFADRLDWKLGDVLEFEIQGVPIQGRIVNFRKIRWSSFEPNFFVHFQAGVLDDTPKTWLAAAPRMNGDEKLAFQRGLLQRFPNISSVDVERVIGRILEMAAQISIVLMVMAIWTGLAGALSLWSMARYEAWSRRGEMNLLKVLGGRKRQVASVFLLEAASISATAAWVGTLAGVGISMALMRTIFQTPWHLDWSAAAGVVLGTLLISLALNFLAARQVWREKPLGLLSDQP